MKIEAARRDGTLLHPSPLDVVWWLMAVLVVLYAVYQAGGLGSNRFFEIWVNNVVLWVAAVMCFLGALRSRATRASWLLVAAAIATWAMGSTIWSIRFGDSPAPPLISVSDIFWLAWYPLIGAALVLLIRDRVSGFDVHRWIDGVAVMLVVATPWAALILQPIQEHSSGSSLAQALNYIYPLCDAILVGATLGIFVLTAWHPGGMWLVLGIALTSMGFGDAIYSVLATGHAHDRGVYDVAWAAGAVLLAYAAWEPQPERVERQTMTGWRAIALPLAVQVIGAAIQAYGFFYELPNSERVLTMLVMLIAAVQIIISRPQPDRDRSTNHSESSPPG